MWSSRRVKSKRASPSVLVLGHGVRAFLTTIRSLGRRGLTVHAAMCSAGDIALASRYTAKFHQLPPYRGDGSNWRAAVTTLAREYRYDLILPCNDESVYPVQRHRTELASYCRIYSLSQETFDIVFDKIESSLLAESLGISVPEQAVVEWRNGADSDFAKLRPPFVVKPPSSFILQNLDVRREVLHIRDREDVEQVLRTCSSWGRALVQKHVRGVGVGVEVLAADGEILAAFQHVRVHEPPQGGASSYRRSEVLNSELLEAARKLITKVRYTGVAMVEFKVDPKTGEWAFIEINGRLWGSLPLAVSAGVDFPYYLYELLVDGRRDFPQSYNANLYCRNILRDLYWISENNKVDPKDSTAQHVSKSQVMREVGNVLLLRERIDSFTFDDPRPGLVEVGEIVEKIVTKGIEVGRRWLFENVCYRWWQARQIRKMASSANTIVFVCHGNICRSPFAKLYAEKIGLRGIEVTSAGLLSKSGRESPATALEVAMEFGVNLHSHRSATVSKEILERANIVFVFDEKNLTRLGAYEGCPRGKIKLLGYLLSKGPVGIEDPYSLNTSEYRAIFGRIADAIDRLHAMIGNDK